MIEFLSCKRKNIIFRCICDRQALIKSNPLRVEVDSAGPLSELQHWERMSLRLNDIIHHIKGPECNASTMALHDSRSNMMKVGMLESSSSIK